MQGTGGALEERSTLSAHVAFVGLLGLSTSETRGRGAGLVQFSELWDRSTTRCQVATGQKRLVSAERVAASQGERASKVCSQ